MTDDPLELLSAVEVAALLKVHPRWVYRAVEREELGYIKVGRFLRFRRSDIEAFLADRSHGST